MKLIQLKGVGELRAGGDNFPYSSTLPADDGRWDEETAERRNGGMDGWANGFFSANSNAINFNLLSNNKQQQQLPHKAAPAYHDRTSRSCWDVRATTVPCGVGIFRALCSPSPPDITNNPMSGLARCCDVIDQKRQANHQRTSSTPQPNSTTTETNRYVYLLSPASVSSTRLISLLSPNTALFVLFVLTTQFATLHTEIGRARPTTNWLYQRIALHFSTHCPQQHQNMNKQPTLRGGNATSIRQWRKSSQKTPRNFAQKSHAVRHCLGIANDRPNTPSWPHFGRKYSINEAATARLNKSSLRNSIEFSCEKYARAGKFSYLLAQRNDVHGAHQQSVGDLAAPRWIEGRRTVNIVRCQAGVEEPRLIQTKSSFPFRLQSANFDTSFAAIVHICKRGTSQPSARYSNHALIKANACVQHIDRIERHCCATRPTDEHRISAVASAFLHQIEIFTPHQITPQIGKRPSHTQHAPCGGRIAYRIDISIGLRLMAAHLRLMGWDERAASTPLTVHQIETACEQFLCRFKRLFTAPVAGHMAVTLGGSFCKAKSKLKAARHTANAR
ncbi:unnamed protein product [Ceratitis capitata]|uniref:(Mediterranean fruit fly) hypothetical protein n=1 Tax=Ceratitis capitata TaxID=7213 RepID=A0A811V6J1_CERCA|nr:unnamed protein product [Ceratitis capitata]